MGKIELYNILLKLKFIDGERDKVVTHIVDYFINNETTIVHYMYYASYVQATRNIKIANTYSFADFILPDGIGMQLCFGILFKKWINNLNGTDMSPKFLEKLTHQNIPISFYGTTAENINLCAQKFKTRFSKSLAYHQDGYSALDFDKIPQKSALFIGLGSPRQEIWVEKNMQIIHQKKLLIFTVGGFFDFYSGFYIRAPKVIRIMKLEWAWRTILHPNRHYQKRLRDLTIVFLPLWHRLVNLNKYIKMREI